MRTVVKNLRRKLGDDATHPTYICTVPRFGYRMAPPETPERQERSAGQAPVLPPGGMRSCRGAAAPIAALLPACSSGVSTRQPAYHVTPRTPAGRQPAVGQQRVAPPHTPKGRSETLGTCRSTEVAAAIIFS